MWTYNQRTGEMSGKPTPASMLSALGYSGHAEGKNNPDLQSIHNVGPIPEGRWTILDDPPPSTDLGPHGPYVLHLAPKPGTETFGRGGFLIHGDSIHAPGTASLGCIILPRTVREAIWQSGDRDLLVVAGVPALPVA